MLSAVFCAEHPVHQKPQNDVSTVAGSSQVHLTHVLVSDSVSYSHAKSKEILQISHSSASSKYCCNFSRCTVSPPRHCFDATSIAYGISCLPLLSSAYEHSGIEIWGKQRHHLLRGAHAKLLLFDGSVLITPHKRRLSDLHVVSLTGQRQISMLADHVATSDSPTTFSTLHWRHLPRRNSGPIHRAGAGSDL